MTAVEGCCSTYWVSCGCSESWKRLRKNVKRETSSRDSGIITTQWNLCCSEWGNRTTSLSQGHCLLVIHCQKRDVKAGGKVGCEITAGWEQVIPHILTPTQFRPFYLVTRGRISYQVSGHSGESWPSDQVFKQRCSSTCHDNTFCWKIIVPPIIVD